MKHSPRIEAQLASFASAADRANRPSFVLMLASAALVAAGLYLVFALSDHLKQRRVLRAAGAEAGRVVALITQIEQAEGQEIDLNSKFPLKQFFGTQIEEAYRGDADAGTQAIPFREPPQVGTRREAPLMGSAAGLQRTEIACTVGNESLEHIFQWVDQVLSHKFLKGQVHVSHLSLRPISPGWGATIHFSVYEFKRTGARL